MSNKESQLAVFLTSSEGMSRGKLYITLAALQCIDSRELNSFLFVQHPQIGSAYVTEVKITLGDSFNIKHFSEAALFKLDSIYVSVHSITPKI